MKVLKNLSYLFLLVGLLASCKPKGEKAETGEAGEVSAATGTEYAVDVASSKVLWEGAKVTGKHNGTINVSEGNVVFDGETLTGGSFTMDMNSIADLDLDGNMKTNLENHLKGTVEGKETDFFNAPKFPTSKFEITKATKLMNNDDANYVINGNLTIKDITKSVSFRAKVDNNDGMVSVSTPPFTIDRTEWDIQFRSNKFFEGLADKAINDEIGLQVNLMAK